MKTIKKTKLNFFTTSILSMLFVVLLSFHAGFSNTLEVLKRGEMEFRVTSIDYNLTVGSYSLMWDITPTDYRINTHLEAKGLASLFINYTLSETSTGIVQHKKLQWNRYEIWQKYDDATRNRYETTYQLPNQSAIKMGDAQVSITDEPIDIPSMIIALMRQLPTPNAQRQVDVFYPRNHHPITMKMQGQESIQVPAGTFLSWKWQGDTDKYNMSLWYDQKSRLPLKVIFVNNHGNRFLLEAKPWQKAHQESD